MDITVTVNDREFTVNTSTIPSDLTLNAFIRQYARLTGTKFMCLEGGCGSCVVTVRRPHPLTDNEETFAINSCLKLFHTCDGYHITTVEALGNRHDGYHPLQTSIDRLHGTQCGFCTSGMIMNMYALLEQSSQDVDNGEPPRLSMAEVERSFDGNLCRCTGYRPILESFRSFACDASAEQLLKCQVDPLADIEELPPRRSKNCATRCSKRRPPRLTAKTVGVQRARLDDDETAVLFCVHTLDDLWTVFAHLSDTDVYQLVAGNTSRGIRRPDDNCRTYIDISRMPELHEVTVAAESLTLGALVTLSEAVQVFDLASKRPGFEYCAHLAQHLRYVANVPVRNVATLAGNLCFKARNPAMPSDVFVLLDTCDARLQTVDASGHYSDYTLTEFLHLNMHKRLLFSIRLPAIELANSAVRSYKVTIRAQNAHAYVNAGFRLRFARIADGRRSNQVTEARICFGGIAPTFQHARNAEELLLTRDIDVYTTAGLQSVLHTLDGELQPDWVLPDAQPAYRKHLAMALFYRFVLSTFPNTPTKTIEPRNASGALARIERPLSSGVQEFETLRSNWPLTEPVAKYEGLQQTSGEARYIDDAPPMAGELWAAFAVADRVHSRVTKIDASAALAMRGVRHFYGAADIPGKNNFTPATILTMEVEQVFLPVGETVLFNGQPIGVVLADSYGLALRAAERVKITYMVAKEQRTNGMYSMARALLSPLIGDVSETRRSIRPTVNDLHLGDLNLNASHPPLISDSVDEPLVSGRFQMAGQYPFHMETQTCVCVPDEERARSLNVFSSTQWPDFTQQAIAEMLAIPQAHVQMVIRRLGGAYGAKITRASQIACACALGAFLSRRSVRLRMPLEANMRSIGKRLGLISDYRATVDRRTGEIKKCSHNFVQDAGCSMNEPMPYKTVPCVPNCYVSDNWTIDGKMVLTDAPSNSFCRSPGSLEGIAMAENLIEHIAHETGLPAMQVRLANLRADHPVRAMLADFSASVEFERRQHECDAFNALNRWRKRGIALVPMQWPLVYFGVMTAYVAIYHGDGSVVVTHGGVECGQGINTKVAQVVAYALGIPMRLVTVRPYDTVTAANATMTGSSTTSETACFAAKRACDALLARMRPVRDQMPAGYTWSDLVRSCDGQRIDLHETYQFKEADVQGYDIYGMCACEVEVDVLTGCYQLRRVDLWEDVGESMNPAVDVGQVEGAFVMGIGYWCTEQLVYDRNDGRLLTDQTWTYKVPGAMDIPVDFRIKFIAKSATNPIFGVLRSKATAEPAICMSVVIVFALRYAINAARKDAGLPLTWFPLGSATTPEQVFMHCEHTKEAFTI